MVITNKLVCRFDFRAIGERYDIYQITTSDRYIAYGSYILDIPTEDLKAVSVAFDQGKSAYAMFDKGKVDRVQLVRLLNDEKLSIRPMPPQETQPFLLARLFLYALPNYSLEENRFNNIGGKLFMTIPVWRRKDGRSFKALEIAIDRELQLSAKATTFTLISRFDKGTKGLAESPRYKLLDSGRLRRTLKDDGKEKVYVNKGLPGKKTELPFLELQVKKIKETKAYFLNWAIQTLNERYKGLLSISFATLEKDETIDERLDSDFDDKSFACVSSHNVCLTSLLEKEYEDDPLRLQRVLSADLKRPISLNSPVDQKDMEIALLHNEEYYQQKDDPYKALSREHVVQCITHEDGLEEAIANPVVRKTIYKEMTIKNDIINARRITLDDWSYFEFDGDWYFGEEKNRQKYFMIIHPDGSFDFPRPFGMFGGYSDPTLNHLSRSLNEFDLKGKTIVMNHRGDVNLISRTNSFCLPNPEIYDLPSFSRSKASRDQYLNGLVDINLFHDKEGRRFYNAGLRGTGMKPSLPKANILYQVTVIKGKNIIKEILRLMSVIFVKYNSFTVLPYPIKYLREYTLIDGAKGSF